MKNTKAVRSMKSMVASRRKRTHAVSWKFRACLLLLIAATTRVVASAAFNQEDGESNGSEDRLSSWQECSVFIAPTTRMNWGIFANRDFSPGEIVEISPLTLPIPDGSDAIERSVLNDYVYGYMRLVPTTPNHRPIIDKLYNVLFGPDMMYNHHPVEPNVQYVTFGREPFDGLPNAVNPSGFVAKRKIRRGEELFSSYNGRDDGGKEWFSLRGITMETPGPPMPKNPSDKASFDQYSKEFCSRIHAGSGLPTWKDRLLPLLPKDYKLPWYADLKWFAPFDAGLGNAKTKVDVETGERLEVSTALVMSQELTMNTALMPLVYAWKDLDPNHREALKLLHAEGSLNLQYQGPETSWRPRNNFTNFEDLVLFPVAGNIGMIRRRTTTDEANCRLVVYPTTNTEDASIRLLGQPIGVTIELVATKDMKASTTLVLDMAESVATPFEYKMLFRELKLTGQPFAKEFFRDRSQADKRKPTIKARTTTRQNEEL